MLRALSRKVPLVVGLEPNQEESRSQVHTREPGNEVKLGQPVNSEIGQIHLHVYLFSPHA